MSYSEIEFRSDGVRCSGWHFHGGSERLEGQGGRPVVVMAHGFGGTKDSGLEPFADRISAAGADVLAFDFRGFGASEGEPRQTVSIKRQVADYHAAVAAAKRLPGVDPSRIAVWGTSLSGGHVFRVGAECDDIAAVIAMTPLTDSLAAGRASVAQGGLGTALRGMLLGVRSKISVARGKDAIQMPLASPPGEVGALALDGSRESYLSIAGPTWRNEVDAAVGLELAKIHTARSAKKLRGRVLVQIADFDRYVPAASVAKTAVHARAEVHHYPCDHFDVWPGHDWFEKVADDQAAFLLRSFAPGSAGLLNRRVSGRAEQP